MSSTRGKLPAGHRPCANPKVCGVRSHRPGTQCKSEYISSFVADRRTIPTAAPPAASQSQDERRGQLEGFSLEDGGYYGNTPPRGIHIDALNGTIQALDRDGKSQLIAACGTGKSYMGRQLLNHYMEGEDANGISVVLTSSRKLAADTVRDMRPGPGGDPSTFDVGFGEYGEDYEVIEVHSEAEDYSLHGVHRPSIRGRDGNISAELIRDQIQDAVDEGRKVVIVSTYKSSRRIQEAQSLLQGDEYEADLIMHDEAHNILGQQEVASKGNGEPTSEGSTYVGFDNSIPGAIQSRKRLYATATPVMREFDGDDESAGDLDRAKEVVQEMGSNPRKRVTFYSTDVEMVGSIGGYISQRDAINEGYLAEPVYQLQESRIRGDVSNLNDPVVDPDGVAKERRDTSNPHPMTPGTYGAVSSTLEAMVRDNPSGASPRNMLIYAGSIEQSESAAWNMKRVALSMSQGMGEREALGKINSSDPDERRRARLRVLSDRMEVAYAHSGMRQADKDQAFRMFQGNEVTSEEWSPDCKVLANVDIFSEGVNIPQIDGITLADRSKMSERGMTQAVGRSIRTMGGNDVKRRGYVVIPEVADDHGNRLNTGDVNRAIYGATRVERGVTARRIMGESIGPDTVTQVERHSSGGVSTSPAMEHVHSMVETPSELVRSHHVTRFRRKSMTQDPDTWRRATPGERLNIVKTAMRERIDYIRGIESPDKRLSRERMHLEAAISIMGRDIYGGFDMEADHVNHSTLMSSIPAGDLSAMNREVRGKFISKGILMDSDTGGGGVSPALSSARDRHVRENINSLVVTAYRNRKSEHSGEIMKVMQQCGIDKSMMSAGYLPMEAGRAPRDVKPAPNLGKPTPGMTSDQVREECDGRSRELLRRLEGNRDLMSKFQRVSAMGEGSRSPRVREGLENLGRMEHELSTERAAMGEGRYVVNPSLVSKDGHLNSRGMARLGDDGD